MKKTEILTVTNNSAINDNAGLMLNSEEWQYLTALSDEEAIEKFNRQAIDVVLIDNKMPESTARKLEAVFKVLDPSVIILNFNNENTGLENEVKAALKARSMKSRSFVVNDDAFKGYRMN